MKIKIKLLQLLICSSFSCLAQDPLAKEIFLDDCVLSIDFSPDSKILASGDGAGNMIVWDVETEKGIFNSPHKNAVWTVVFNNAGTEVLSGGGEKFEYRKTSVKDRKTEILTYGSDIGVWNIYSALYSKNDKKYYLSGTAYNAKNNLKTTTLYRNIVYELAASNDGNYIAAAGCYNLVLFNVDNTVTELDKVEHRAVDFSPNNKYLATVQARNNIQMWDLATLKVIKEFALPDQWDYTETLKFSKDGNFLVSGSYNGLIYIWEISTGKLIKQINAHAKLQKCVKNMPRQGNSSVGINCIKFSNDGKYLASCGNDKAIRLWDWVTLLPVEYRKLLKENETPTLTIESPDMSKGKGFITANHVVKIKGNVKDTDGIAKLKIKNNAIQPDDQGNFELDIYLTDGENEIGIEATDKRGAITKQMVTVTKDYSASNAISTKGEKLPRIFAVIVGISSYINAPQYNLKYADKDATELYNFLKSPSGGSVPDENISLITGEKATRISILNEITEKLAYAEETDVFIFYYSGHGDILGNNEQVGFYTYDCNPSTTNLLKFSGIQQNELKDLVYNSKPKKKVMFLDACHSGFLTTTAAKGNGNMSTSLLNEMSKTDAALTILTSSSNNENSYEDASLGGGHGIFTYYLLEGLKGGADKATTGNKNGFVTVNELSKYIAENVPKQSRKAHGVEQRPKELCDRCNDFPISVVNP